MTAAMGPTEIPMITQASVAAPAAGSTGQAKIHRVAKQFEAMFMTEMLHQAHGKSKAVGAFRTGEGESTMQSFMDQALGEAAASHGGTGLARSIERMLGGLPVARSGK
jgi:flagellar protein FlgJ